MKLAFISRHPAPYRDEFIGRLVKTEGLSVDVFSELPFDEGHAFWGLKQPPYRAEIIAKEGVGKVRLCFRMLRRLVFGGYDFVVYPGHQSIYLIVPMLVGALLGRRYCLCADSVRLYNRMWLKNLIKKFVIRKAEFVFVPGECGKRFFVQTFGVAAEKICTGLYSLNGEALSREVAALRPERESVRKSLGIDIGQKVFLMVANMIPSRCYPLLARAFVAASAGRADMCFVAIGKGPDLAEVQRIAQENPFVKVVPGCSFEEMKRYYAIADVYVHGGSEPASTALVIGAISGLPLISSEAVGCSFDVLIDGETGIRVDDFLSSTQWTEAFLKMMAASDRWKEYGAAAREASRSIDLDVSLERFVRLLKRDA